MTSKTLPIYSAIDEIVNAIETYRKVVIHAPPGTGKSTVVPLELYRRLGSPGDIRVSQPRRLAARSLATYVASLAGTKVGETVGYEVRFDRKITGRTKIRFATDGLLLRQVLSDPLMEKTSGIVIDEFHERSIRNDLLAACVREIAETRDDFFTVIMSATLAADDVATFFDAPIVSVEAPIFPLEISHLDRASSLESLHDDLDKTVSQALESTEGDVLVFLPGVRDIEIAATRCEKRAQVDVRKLYGALSPKDQSAALKESDRRRVIFSTNVAETSLTVPGVRVVIDSGWEKVNVFDPSTGFDRLQTQRISEASATQRSGRAAREAAGSAYRLWSTAESFRFQAFRPAEIQRVDPIRALLEAAEWAGSVSAMRWYEPPPDGASARAHRELVSIGAIDEASRITAFGKRLLTYPLAPRLAALYEHAVEHDLKPEAALLTAILGERDSFDPPKSSVDCDVCFRAKQLASQRSHPSYKTAKQVLGGAPSFSAPVKRLRRLLFETYPDRLAIKRGDNRYALSGGGSVTLVGSRVDSDIILALRIHGTKKVDGVSCGKVFYATAIDQEWIDEAAHIDREVVFDPDTETVSVFAVRRFADLELDRKRGAKKDASSEEICAALLPAAQSKPRKAFKVEKKAEQFLARYAFAFGSSPFDDETVVRALIGSATSFKQTRSKSLLHELKRIIPYEQISKLDREFPASIRVPSGKTHAIDYSVEPPVLAVRIQELFGWETIPDIGFTIRLHLLAPNYRPAQITDDLTSFWDTTYPEVRKELRARYPKHAWPEDPRATKAKAK